MTMPVEQCPDCGLWMLDGRRLDEHFAKEHAGRFQFRCEFCPAPTASREDLVNHLNEKHHGVIMAHREGVA